MKRIARTTASVAVLALLALAAACAAPGSLPDTPDNRLTLARELADLAVELGSLDRALDRGAELGERASSAALEIELGRELSQAEQTQVFEIMRNVLSEFLTADLWKENVVRVYAEEFTTKELRNIKDFYSSPSGRKVLGSEAAMTAKVDAGLESAFDGRLDEFIARLDEEFEAWEASR